jgi:hypothetical protein
MRGGGLAAGGMCRRVRLCARQSRRQRPRLRRGADGFERDRLRLRAFVQRKRQSARLHPDSRMASTGGLLCQLQRLCSVCARMFSWLCCVCCSCGGRAQASRDKPAVDVCSSICCAKVLMSRSASICCCRFVKAIALCCACETGFILAYMSLLLTLPKCTQARLHEKMNSTGMCGCTCTSGTTTVYHVHVGIVKSIAAFRRHGCNACAVHILGAPAVPELELAACARANIVRLTHGSCHLVSRKLPCRHQAAMLSPASTQARLTSG